MPQWVPSQTQPGMEVYLDEDGRVVDTRYTGASSGVPSTAGPSAPMGPMPSSSGGGRTTTLERLQEAERGMIDALAQGNREKFEEFKRQYNEAQRLRYSELFGYDPGSASGGGGGGGPAVSIADKRKRLKEAGYGEADTASDAEIDAVWKRTAKPEDQDGAGGASGGGGMGAGPNASLGAQIKAIYKTVAARKGVASLAPNDPDLVSAVATATGLQPQRVQAALQQGKTYYERTGEVIPDSVLGQSFNKELPFGQNPTLDSRRFLDDQERFAKSFGEGQRQFNVSQAGGMARSLLEADTNLRGPRDYRAMQRMRSGGKDILDQLMGSEVQPGTGLQGTPERASSDDLLAALGLMRRPRAA